MWYAFRSETTAIGRHFAKPSRALRTLHFRCGTIRAVSITSIQRSASAALSAHMFHSRPVAATC